MPLTGPTDKDDAWIASTVQRNPFKRYPNPDTGKDEGNWLTAPARLSFGHLFKPQEAMEEGGKPKYSASFLFPQGVDLAAFRQDLNRVGQEKWGDQFAVHAKNPNFHKPLKDQEEKAQYEGYVVGHQFFTASGERRPQVTTVRGAPITDEAVMHAGVWVIGIVRPFAFEAKNRQGAIVKRGVSVGLQAICFIADDKEFGGGAVDAVKAFAGVQVEGEAYDPNAAFSGGAGAPAGDYANLI